MGRRGPAGDFLVEHMVGPGPRADHRRTSFRPDADWQWSEMRRLHRALNGDLSFLGDWHTHPRASRGDLSRTDIEALAEILLEPKTRAEHVVSAILFGGRHGWGWSVWVAAITIDADGRRSLTAWMSDLHVVPVVDPAR